MNILEMHDAFRVLAQQLGMQTTRAVLPEHIDIFINLSIIEYINTTIKENVTTVYKEQVSSKENTIEAVSSITNLYKVANITTFTGSGIETSPYQFIFDHSDEVLAYTGLFLSYINKNCKIRIIESNKIDNIINDYCNRPTWNYPVGIILTNDTSTIINVYTGNENIYTPKSLGIRYISNPNIVKYSEQEQDIVNCNLSSSVHPKIIEMAVDKYFNSIGATSKSSN